MLRCFLQQRSFHQSTAQWTYSRTALRRLKKPELVALAGQHKLDSTGTKNDLIDRLLTKPQETNVTLKPSNSAEPQETNVTLKPSNSAEPQEANVALKPSNSAEPQEANVALKPSNSAEPQEANVTLKPSNSAEPQEANVALKPSNSAEPQGANVTLKPSNSAEPQEANVTLKPSNSAEPQEANVTLKPSNSAEPQQTPSPAAASDEEGYDEQWVEAFDLKVGNRRSGVLGRERSSLFNRATSSTTHPAYVHQTVGAEPTNTPISMSAHRPTTDDEPMDPEINQHWVKVFDQRVKTRTKIMGLNTLDIDPKMPSTTESPSPASPAGNDTISAVIGTSMAVWYILGGDGIQSTFSSFFS